jgi:hypothetical protein
MDPPPDIEDVKQKCYQQSRLATDDWRGNRTVYQDDYIRWPLDQVSTSPGPPSGVHIGTGNLAPSDNDLRSHYAQTYIRHPTGHPEAAAPVPDSDFFSYGYGIPKTTTQSANDEVVGKTAPFDPSESKTRGRDSRSTHFGLGTDAPGYETNYSDNFRGARGPAAAPADNSHLKSSIEFDHDAGYGPNTRRGHRRARVPEKPDVERRDQHATNYDIGHFPLDYETTSGAAGHGRRNVRPVERVPRPKDAELADHGPAAGRWGSSYKDDFQRREPIPNDVDTMDLRGTHFDPGHEDGDWSRKTYAAASRMPERVRRNLQESNQVFRGDGGMRFGTTANELTGAYDRNADGRGRQVADARADHFYVGADPPAFETTLQNANRFAGKGRPADLVPEPASGGFARGGDWDPHVGAEQVSEKSWRPVEQPKGKEGAYARGTHFEVEATGKNKGRYKTEYFERYCRPKVAEFR